MDMIANNPQYDEDIKSQFAVALLKNPKEPFKAALFLFNGNVQQALMAATDWVHDPYVLEKKKELIEEFGEAKFLPTKFEVAREVIEIAREETDNDIKLKGYRLYGDYLGYIEKPGNTINNQYNQHNVMLIKDHGNDDEWENKLLEQQAKLVEGNVET